MTDAETKFAVVAEKRGHGKSLYLHDLTFARLIDDVIVPYESDKPFFIDGVPLKRDELTRIKIVQQSQLGHASVQTTLDRYGHLLPETQHIASERLDAQIFGANVVLTDHLQTAPISSNPVQDSLAVTATPTG